MPGKTINFATTYQEPIQALLDGQPVTLLATGDVEGMSPSFQCVDQNGKVDWAAASRVTITDHRALPSGTDANRLYQQNSSGSRQPVGAGSRS